MTTTTSTTTTDAWPGERWLPSHLSPGLGQPAHCSLLYVANSVHSVSRRSMLRATVVRWWWASLRSALSVRRVAARFVTMTRITAQFVTTARFVTMTRITAQFVTTARFVTMTRITAQFVTAHVLSPCHISRHSLSPRHVLSPWHVSRHILSPRHVLSLRAYHSHGTFCRYGTYHGTFCHTAQ